MIEYIAYCVVSSFIVLAFIFIPPTESVWVVVKENGKYVAKSEEVKDLRRGEEYYTSYQRAFRAAKSITEFHNI